ncbi:hypothetical protein MMC14_006474 [Varicellaria rhodocarpa]|nr:hypothetical protein [Varicellaria rhodocarpa]
MNYEPLISTSNQIRLITLLPYAQSNIPTATQVDQFKPLVRCQIENVSLDDRSEKYRRHLAAGGSQVFGRTANQSWISTCLQEAGLQVGDLKRDGSTSAFWRFGWGDYTALSYAWGEQIAARPIIVDGVYFQVTENLEAALRHLCTRPDFLEGVKLWVDALCINQNDVEERNLQVLRMRNIYSQAMCVVTWLGQEAEESDEAFELLEKFCEKNSHSVEEALAYLEAVRTTCDLFPPGSWIALYRFLDRPYWKRLWIIQEVAMSHSTVQVFCGTQSLYWLELCRAIELVTVEPDLIEKTVSENFEQAEAEYTSGSILSRLERMQHLQIFSQAEASGQDGPDLFMRLLKASRFSEQKDPRDKIFGVLGLMNPSIQAHIQPDYNSSILGVYSNFAKTVINTTGNLDIICQSRVDVSQSSEFPSWIPGWRGDVEVSHELHLLTPFEACGTSGAVVHFKDQGRLLCKGFKVDFVDGIGCTCWNLDSSYHDIVQPSQTHNPYDGVQAVETALWRTLTANRDGWGEVAPDWFSNLIKIPWKLPSELHDLAATMDYHLFDKFRTCKRTLRIFGRELQSYFPTGPIANHLDIPRSKLLEAVTRLHCLLWKRRLLITGKGYIGLAPRTAQQGDIICILLGCSTPVALRHHADYYKLIGECYIHGLMEGEAMKWLNTKDYGLADFSLN